MAKIAVPYRIIFFRYCTGKTFHLAPALWKFWSFLCLSYKKKNNMAKTVVVYKIIFSDIALARIFIWLPRFEGSIVLNGNLNLMKSNYFFDQVFNTSGPA